MNKIVKGIGKALAFPFKAGGLVLGETTLGLGKAGLGVGHIIGNQVEKSFSKDASKFIGSIGLGMAGGAVMADLAGESKKDGAMTMGAIGLGAATLGKAGVMTGLGSAAGAVGIQALGMTAGLGRSLVKMPTAEEFAKKGLLDKIGDLGGVKVSKLGKVAFLGAALLGGVKSAAKKYDQIHMGVGDGMITTATPRIPQVQGNIDYSNTGASGDLVFAMHNNR